MPKIWFPFLTRGRIARSLACDRLKMLKRFARSLACDRLKMLKRFAPFGRSLMRLDPMSGVKLPTVAHHAIAELVGEQRIRLILIAVLALLALVSRERSSFTGRAVVE
jgi:hypothetical protein